MSAFAVLIRPLPDVHTAPGKGPTVTVVGELLYDAHMRIEPATQRATLDVRIGQPGDDSPIMAVQIGGDDAECAQDFAARAATLRQGMRVRVRGEGLGIRFERGQRYFRLGGACTVEAV